MLIPPLALVAGGSVPEGSREEKLLEIPTEGCESRRTRAPPRPCSSKLFLPLPLSLLAVRLRAKVAAAVPGLGGSWKLDCRATSVPAAMAVKAFLDLRAKLG